MPNSFIVTPKKQPEMGKKAIKYLTFLLLFFSCSKQTDNEQNVQFLKYYGGSADDKALSIALCSDGGYILTGSLITSNNVKHAYVLKTTSNGERERLTTLFENDTFSTSACRVAIDGSGNYLIVGTMNNLSTARDVLVAKINPDGEVVWTKTFGGSADDEGLCIANLNSGNILVGGYTKSSGNGEKDAWVLELNADGSKVWSKTYGYAGNDVCNHLLETDDCYLLTGYSENLAYTPSRKELFLVKINKSFGGIAASVRYGGEGDRLGIKTIADADKNFYVLINSQLDSLSGFGIVKLNNDFYQKIWEKFSDNTENKVVTDFLLHDNTLVVTGYTNSGSNNNILVNLLDIEGNIKKTWSDAIKSKSNLISYSSAMSNDGFLALSGSLEINSFSKITLLKVDISK
jgi:hypothetical protein